MRTHEELLQYRREYWHRTKDRNKEQKAARRRAWYARTKKDRREKILQYSRARYWKDRANQLERTKRWKRAHPEYMQRYELIKTVRRAGISMTDYESMVSGQKNLCAICRQATKAKRGLGIDHDHKTGKVRGLLCPNCNMGLGRFDDSPEMLRRAADYIEWHRKDAPNGHFT